MEDLLQILQKPLQQREVEVSDLPDLDLYMDQITTLFADKTQESDGYAASENRFLPDVGKTISERNK